MARFSPNAKHNHQLITLVKRVRIFVKMFVICWWVSTYVAELFEFKFTLPNNPSKFTRCHRKSGRMCGLLPSMTFFMTASIVFKNKSTSTIAGLLSVWWNVLNGFLCRLGLLGFQQTRRVTPCSTRGSNISITKSHNVVRSFQPQRYNATLTMVSNIDSRVWSPNVHNITPDVVNISNKIGVLEQTLLAFIGFVSNMTKIVGDRKCMWDYLSMEETSEHGILGRHQSCSEERIEVLSNLIERYDSSRNTPSLLYSKSC